MRVAFFSDSYFPAIDGVTYTLKSWKQRLEDRGHEVFIVYPDSGRYEPEEGEIPVPSVLNPFYSGYNIPLPTSMDRFPDVDVVHCHGPGPIGIAGRLYAWRRGLPSVYTHHTPLEEYFEQEIHSQAVAGALARAYLPLEHRYLRSFDAVTASTPRIDREVQHIEMPVGVDTEFFHPTDTGFIDGLGLEGPVAGYSGRLSLEKNPGELVAFAEEFEGSLVIVGEGPQRERIERLAPDNTLVMDFLPREMLPDFYTGLDVFVTASAADTLGLSVLEANACGTPVVTPDVEPFSHTVDERNGMRYRTGDTGDLVSTVDSTLSGDFDPREAVKPFSLGKTIDRLERIYQKLG